MNNNNLLKNLVKDCMASDFNEHWDSYKDAVKYLEGETKEVKESAEDFLRRKGIYSLDTKKRTQQVYEWMEEYAAQFNQSVPASEVRKVRRTTGEGGY